MAPSRGCTSPRCAPAFLVFVKLGLYRAVMRFVGSKVVGVVFVGVTVSVLVLFGVINELFASEALPWETFAIYWAVALVYVGGSRLLVRHVLYARKPGAARVVIYGAGTAGAQVANALRSGGRFEPVAFLDDDPSLQNSVVAGIKVFSPTDLPQLVESRNVDVVLLALPSQSRQRRQQIIKRIEPLPVRVMTVPDISDLLAGEAQVEDLRDVDVGDLLGRDPVSPNEYLFDACIRDKVVMVTGAGGSIGSELCRQILRNGPRRLVLLEMSELALYSIERELARQMKHDGRLCRADRPARQRAPQVSGPRDHPVL